MVGYYTDFIITEKIDNFGKQQQANIQCVANTQKTFVYMKYDSRSPLGVSFHLANGKVTSLQPDLN
ncbi:MAG: hypothetical protein J0J01_10605 [Reyranella sp.]|uniref:hypothetical protein n=1 Tax=Reyranella sp. TaxID=1929291 RepID=UPI001AC31AC1|nr:hypothetical protein [Reyranella sp.]MBN9087346.1 hypothetical protein [Reyranella sp.]